MQFKLRALFLAGLFLVAGPALAVEPEPEMIEPGNELLVVIPSPKPEEHKVTVDADGYIVLGRYGRVQVAGQTTQQAEKAVRAFLGKYIVNTRIITLVRTDTKRLVFVSGQVKESGFVRVGPKDNLWQAIQRAGGPLDGADLARVLLVRGGGETLVDVQSWLAHATTEPLPSLKVGDTIFVAAFGVQPKGENTRAVFLGQKALEGKLFVLGAVRSPGLFDHAPGLTGLTAIGLAGGPDKDADLSGVRLLTRDGSRQINMVKALMGTGSDAAMPRGRTGAILFVPQRRDGSQQALGSQINVLGGLNRPGRYSVAHSVNLAEAIALGGGPTQNADVDEVHLLRQGPGFTFGTEYDLEEMLEDGGLAALVRVAAGDTVYMDQSDLEFWPTFVRVLSDLAIVSAAVVIFVGIAQAQDSANSDSGGGTEPVMEGM